MAKVVAAESAGVEAVESVAAVDVAGSLVQGLSSIVPCFIILSNALAKSVTNLSQF